MTINKKYIEQFVNVTIKAALAASYLVGKKDKIEVHTKEDIYKSLGLSKTEKSEDELIEEFGMRKMSNATIRNQSWCRRCR